MQHPIFRNTLFPIVSFIVTTSALHATVLSNNLNQPIAYTELIDASTSVAASFGTGNYSSTLQNVQLLIQLDGQTNPAIWLYTDQAGAPGSAVGSLALLQPRSASALGTAFFSGQNLALAPNSTYWVVAQPSSGAWQWAYTSSNLGTGLGFQHTWGVSLDGGAWFISDNEPMMMSVEDAAPAIPEPGSFVLLGLGALGLGVVGSRRRVKPSAAE